MRGSSLAALTTVSMSRVMTPRTCKDVHTRPAHVRKGPIRRLGTRNRPNLMWNTFEPLWISGGTRPIRSRFYRQNLQPQPWPDSGSRLPMRQTSTLFDRSQAIFGVYAMPFLHYLDGLMGARTGMLLLRRHCRKTCLALNGHLGLKGYDPAIPSHLEALAQRLDHPGITCWNLHAVRLSHTVFQPHLRFCRGLPARYGRFQPELFRVLVDMRQPPR